jgi:hypothetical protein
MNQERFIVLKVIYDTFTKRVGVEGPIDNKPLCCQMLANGIIAVINAPKEESKIVKPLFIPPRDVGKK